MKKIVFLMFSLLIFTACSLELQNVKNSINQNEQIIDNGWLLTNNSSAQTRGLGLYKVFKEFTDREGNKIKLEVIGSKKALECLVEDPQVGILDQKNPCNSSKVIEYQEKLKNYGSSYSKTNNETVYFNYIIESKRAILSGYDMQGKMTLAPGTIGGIDMGFMWGDAKAGAIIDNSTPEGYLIFKTRYYPIWGGTATVVDEKEVVLGSGQVDISGGPFLGWWKYEVLFSAPTTKTTFLFGWRD